MAVNGVEFEVGQVWESRGGQCLKILEIHRSSHYPVLASKKNGMPKSYTMEGRFSDLNETSNDLVHYVSSESKGLAGVDTCGWVVWGGGECPVASGTAVHVELRGGGIHKTKHPESLHWLHTGNSGDIVKYLTPDVAEHKLCDEAKVEVVGGSPAASVDIRQVAFGVPGYEKLEAVLTRAYDQAARGKGAERHANNRPFHEQPMLAICRNLGSIDGMLYQASKKAMEARGLPTRERALAEIYGALNYLAGAAILIEEGIIKGQAK